MVINFVSEIELTREGATLDRAAAVYPTAPAISI